MSNNDNKLKINIDRLRKSRWTYILASAIFIILGLMLIFDPANTSAKLAFLFGGALVAYGVFRLVSYFVKSKGEKNVSIDVILGTLLIICGLAVIFLRSQIADLFSFILGAFVIVDGMLKLQTAINAKRSAIDSWWVVLASALLCIALGCVLIFTDFTGNVLWIILGTALLFDGVQNLISSIYSHLIVKKNPETVPINIENHKPDNGLKELHS